MIKCFKYAMLIGSLPVHPTDLLAAKQTPLSRIRLDERLRLLEEKDTQDLRRIEELLHWSQIPEATDEFIIKKSGEVIAAIHDRFLRDMIIWRLELRTLMVALRMRHAGYTPTAERPFIGFGQWLGYVQSHWQKPDFGLGLRMPWLVIASQLLSRNQTLALEKLQLNLVWQQFALAGGQHYFDFPAVVIYVLRWDIINRWTHYQADEAIKRFDAITEAALAEFNLPLEGN